MNFIETVARAVHEQYLADMLAAGHRLGERAALVSWEQLPEDYRHASKAQAAGVQDQLRRVACRVVPLEDGQAVAFSEAELEAMARAEHRRWMDDQLAAGKVYGPQRDDDAEPPTHPCLVPYDELPPAEQQKDLDAVRAIPALLAGVGYGLRRE